MVLYFDRISITSFKESQHTDIDLVVKRIDCVQIMEEALVLCLLLSTTLDSRHPENAIFRGYLKKRMTVAY